MSKQVGKFGKTSFFEYIAKKRAEAREKAIESLEAHAILDDLLGSCYTHFNKDVDNDWYHLMVKMEYKDWWLKVWEKYSGQALTDISCSCQTQGGRPHVHMIVAFPKGKLTNTFNKAFNAPYRKRINPFLPYEEKKKQRAECRKYYLKPIRTAVHFLHTLLYISTKDTNGFHEGKLMSCEHYAHTFLAFESKKEMNLWRNEIFLPKHPDIAKKMQEEWELLESKRMLRNASSDVPSKKYGLYNGKAIKKTD